MSDHCKKDVVVSAMISGWNWRFPNTPLMEMSPGDLCLVTDPPPEPGTTWLRFIRQDGEAFDRIQLTAHP